MMKTDPQKISLDLVLHKNGHAPSGALDDTAVTSPTPWRDAEPLAATTTGPPTPMTDNESTIRSSMAPWATDPAAMTDDESSLHTMECASPMARGSYRHWSLTLALHYRRRAEQFTPAVALELVQLGRSHPVARHVDMYLQQEVREPQSLKTLNIKSHDLLAFVRWFVSFHGHGNVAAWQPRDMLLYGNHLNDNERRAPSAVKRALATLQHFCHWSCELSKNILACDATGKNIKHRVALVPAH